MAIPSMAGAAQASPAALLDGFAWQLLAFEPADATRLGVDTGTHAGLRRELGDRSPAGDAVRRRFLDQALAELARVPRAGLDPATQTSLAVTDSA